MFSTNIGIYDWKRIVATSLVVLAVAFVVLLLMFRQSRSIHRDLKEVMSKVDQVLNELQTQKNSAGELVFLTSPVDSPDSWYSEQFLNVFKHWQHHYHWATVQPDRSVVSPCLQATYSDFEFLFENFWDLFTNCHTLDNSWHYTCV